jgi:small subunit ribosomal protein S17
MRFNKNYMKIFTGKVISTKMKNTATVSVESALMHKLYKKRLVKSKKYHVHDEYGVKVGEIVNFTASKPYSKLKKWKIVKVEKKRGKLPKVQNEPKTTGKGKKL